MELLNIDRFLADLASPYGPIAVSFQWRLQFSNDNDEMVLDTKVNGRA